MKLLLFQPNLTLKGGQERVVLEIAKKFNPKIYCFNYNRNQTYEEFKRLDVNIIKKVPFDDKFFPRMCKEFYNLKVKEDYDVINAHWPPSEWIRNKNERVLWYCHSPSRAMYDLYKYRMKEFPLKKKVANYLFAKVYRKIDKKIVNKIEYVFANSKNTQNRLKTYLNKDSEVLNPCIDYENYKLGKYGNYFLVPGRIDPTKRIEYCLEAFKKFKKINKKFNIVVAGSILPHHKDYLKMLRNSYGISSTQKSAKQISLELKKYNAKILINVSEKKLKQLYENCYAVLFSAINEDFGIIPLEAMASYKPIISVNEGGPRETILNNKTGFLINSVDEMKKKMLYLAENKDIAEELGKEGRKYVQENYNWKLFLKRFEEKCKDISKSQ